MITRFQKINIHAMDGSVTTQTVPHIFAPTGHFVTGDGRPCGWHIMIGTYDAADNYTEVDDGSPARDIHDYGDIDVYEGLDVDPDISDDDYVAAAKIIFNSN